MYSYRPEVPLSSRGHGVLCFCVVCVWCVTMLCALAFCMLPPLPRLLVLRELRLLTKFRTVIGISTFLRVKVQRNLS